MALKYTVWEIVNCICLDQDRENGEEYGIAHVGPIICGEFFG
jgi:hypothetical protein